MNLSDMLLYKLMLNNSLQVVKPVIFLILWLKNLNPNQVKIKANIAQVNGVNATIYFNCSEVSAVVYKFTTLSTAKPLTIFSKKLYIPYTVAAFTESSPKTSDINYIELLSIITKPDPVNIYKGYISQRVF